MATGDKLVTLDELKAVKDYITPAHIGAVSKTGDTMTGPLTINGNYQHYWVDSTGARRWCVYPKTDGSEFYIATQNYVNGVWSNWKALLQVYTDGRAFLDKANVGNLKIKDVWPAIQLYANNGTQETGSITSHKDNGRVYITEHSIDGTKEEYYQLPVADGTGTFDILTSKGGTMAGTLVLSKTTDASGTADNGPALVVGGTRTAAHIEIDNNEILAKSDGTHETTLYLNSAAGGTVEIGAGGLKMNGSLKWANASSLSASTNLGYILGIDSFANGGTTHCITTGDLRNNVGAPVILLNSTTGATGLNVDFSKYGAFIIGLPDNMTTTVRIWGTANAEFWSTASIYGSSAAPVVLKSYCWKVNSDATGFYINTSKSYQINFSESASPSLNQITNNKFYRVWGIPN